MLAKGVATRPDTNFTEDAKPLRERKADAAPPSLDGDGSSSPA
jgi:hypothetical protein